MGSKPSKFGTKRWGYRGEKMNGMYHGNGRFWWINETDEYYAYVGKWENGKRCGIGVFYTPNGRFCGVFEDDKFSATKHFEYHVYDSKSIVSNYLAELDNASSFKRFKRSLLWKSGREVAPEGKSDLVYHGRIRCDFSCKNSQPEPRFQGRGSYLAKIHTKHGIITRLDGVFNGLWFTGMATYITKELFYGKAEIELDENNHPMISNFWRDGEGIYVTGERKKVYAGSFENDQLSGVGKIFELRGNEYFLVYEGGLEKWKRDGSGKQQIMWPERDDGLERVLVGNWTADKLRGEVSQYSAPRVRLINPLVGDASSEVAGGDLEKLMQALGSMTFKPESEITVWKREFRGSWSNSELLVLHMGHPAEGTTYYPSSNVKYRGKLKNGRFHHTASDSGEGTLYYDMPGERVKYAGFWEGGKRSGFGRLFSDNSRLVYEGNWDNDQMNGKGKYFGDDVVVKNNWPCPRYDGDWVNGKREGFGKQYFSSSCVMGTDRMLLYAGHWKNDMRNGYGTGAIMNTNNRSNQLFIGYWKEGVVCGFGSMYSVSSKTQGTSRKIVSELKFRFGCWKSQNELCGYAICRNLELTPINSNLSLPPQTQKLFLQFPRNIMRAIDAYPYVLMEFLRYGSFLNKNKFSVQEFRVGEKIDPSILVNGCAVRWGDVKDGKVENLIFTSLECAPSCVEIPFVKCSEGSSLQGKEELNGDGVTIRCDLSIRWKRDTSIPGPYMIPPKRKTNSPGPCKFRICVGSLDFAEITAHMHHQKPMSILVRFPFRSEDKSVVPEFTSVGNNYLGRTSSEMGAESCRVSVVVLRAKFLFLAIDGKLLTGPVVLDSRSMSPSVIKIHNISRDAEFDLRLGDAGSQQVKKKISLMQAKRVGELWYPNGQMYRGCLKNLHRVGQGSMHYCGAETVTGTWIKDKPLGLFRVTSAVSKRITGRVHRKNGGRHNIFHAHGIEYFVTSPNISSFSEIDLDKWCNAISFRKCAVEQSSSCYLQLQFGNPLDATRKRSSGMEVFGVEFGRNGTVHQKEPINFSIGFGRTLKRDANGSNNNPISIGFKVCGDSVFFIAKHRGIDEKVYDMTGSIRDSRVFAIVFDYGAQCVKLFVKKSRSDKDCGFFLPPICYFDASTVESLRADVLIHPILPTVVLGDAWSPQFYMRLLPKDEMRGALESECEKDGYCLQPSHRYWGHEGEYRFIKGEWDKGVRNGKGSVWIEGKSKTKGTWIKKKKEGYFVKTSITNDRVSKTKVVLYKNDSFQEEILCALNMEMDEGTYDVDDVRSFFLESNLAEGIFAWCLPKKCFEEHGILYNEIEVVGFTGGNVTGGNDEVLGVGFTKMGEDGLPEMSEGSMVGWDDNTVGFHLDDMGVFFGTGRAVARINNGLRIGHMINKNTGLVGFTINGVLCTDVLCRIDLPVVSKLVPIISSEKGVSFRICSENELLYKDLLPFKQLEEDSHNVDSCSIIKHVESRVGGKSEKRVVSCECANLLNGEPDGYGGTLRIFQSSQGQFRLLKTISGITWQRGQGTFDRCGSDGDCVDQLPSVAKFDLATIEDSVLCFDKFVIVRFDHCFVILSIYNVYHEGDGSPMREKHLARGDRLLNVGKFEPDPEKHGISPDDWKDSNGKPTITSIEELLRVERSDCETETESNVSVTLKVNFSNSISFEVLCEESGEYRIKHKVLNVLMHTCTLCCNNFREDRIYLRCCDGNECLFCLECSIATLSQLISTFKHGFEFDCKYCDKGKFQLSEVSRVLRDGRGQEDCQIFERALAEKCMECNLSEDETLWSCKSCHELMIVDSNRLLVQCGFCTKKFCLECGEMFSLVEMHRHEVKCSARRKRMQRSRKIRREVGEIVSRSIGSKCPHAGCGKFAPATLESEHVNSEGNKELKLECTHITCPPKKDGGCEKKYCYICEKRFDNFREMIDHNIDWKNRPDRCPLHFSAIRERNRRWPRGNDGIKALKHFLKCRCMYNLRKYFKVLKRRKELKLMKKKYLEEAIEFFESEFKFTVKEVMAYKGTPPFFKQGPTRRVNLVPMQQMVPPMQRMTFLPGQQRGGNRNNRRRPNRRLGMRRRPNRRLGRN